MKNLLLAVSILFCSMSVQAFEDGQWNVHLGAGGNSTRGLVGVSGERFFSPNHALLLAAGVDFVGATATTGYRYFGEKIPKVEGPWGKCFFTWECDSHLYGGIAAQYANSTRLEISENGQLQRSYDIGEKYLALASFGFRSVLKNNITIDAEFVYKKTVSGGKSVQTYGSAADDTKAREMGQNGVGAGVAIGYLF